MKYFDKFRQISYVFGDEFEKPGASGATAISVTQDLTQYVEVVDQLRFDASFYNKYNIIENERPDQVSQKLYGTPTFHWTFYMMNDNIRSHGWPLTQKQLTERVETDHPNHFLQFRADITNIYLQGDVVLGDLSGARGRILRRFPDLGVIIVQMFGSARFRANENIQIILQAPGHTASNIPAAGKIPCVATGFEYNSTHHWENSAGEYVDIDPRVGAAAIYNEVTVRERYERLNNDLKAIRVIRPENISVVATAFKKALTS
jgi:hypothetical protein